MADGGRKNGKRPYFRAAAPRILTPSSIDHRASTIHHPVPICVYLRSSAVSTVGRWHGMMRVNWDEAPEFGRRETLLRTLRYLHRLRRGPVTIVETGTLRNDTASGREGDGWSTVAWGWYCS